MLEQTQIDPQRSFLIEQVRHLLFEKMNAAWRDHDWAAFGRYADAYCRMVG